jgi:hypothetical protein
VWAWREQGWPGHAIAAHLGLGQSPVWCDLRPTTWPERTRRADWGRSILTPDQPYR